MTTQIKGERLDIEPLSSAAFSQFGEVIEATPSSVRMINGGTTERHHALFVPEAVGEGARVVINMFRGQPRTFPYSVDMMERHPLGRHRVSILLKS